MLASEYGGGPRAILDGVYLDELLPLIKKINARRVQGWKMQTAIATFPHMDKKARENFVRDLDKMSPPEVRANKNKFDSAGFEALKLALSQNPRFVVK